MYEWLEFNIALQISIFKFTEKMKIAADGTIFYIAADGTIFYNPFSPHTDLELKCSQCEPVSSIARNRDSSIDLNHLVLKRTRS